MDEVVRILVRGRVQGVGFRYFTERQASRLGLVGWVRNLPGGEVEVLVRLPAGLKARFLAVLRQGPPMARVEALEVRAADATEILPAAGFQIRH
jgi:acylphosphatase